MKPQDISKETLRSIVLTPLNFDVARWVHTEIHHKTENRAVTEVIDAQASLTAAMERLYEEDRRNKDTRLNDLLEGYWSRHRDSSPWQQAGLKGVNLMQEYGEEIRGIHEVAGNLLDEDPQLVVEITALRKEEAGKRESEIPAPPEGFGSTDALLEVIKALGERGDPLQ